MRPSTRQSTDDGPKIRSPLALAATSFLAVAVFVVVLGTLAFLWRDRTFGAGYPRRPPHEAVEAVRPSPGPLEQQSAGTVAAPAFRSCEAEARRRDPSLGRELELYADLRTTDDGGVIHGVSLGRGSSPYLATCLKESLDGARFPARSQTSGRVGWRLVIENDVVNAVPLALP
ncbi:MAG: hypothetical protein ACO3JL_10625 [Myxococcota bacterium]